STGVAAFAQPTPPVQQPPVPVPAVSQPPPNAPSGLPQKPDEIQQSDSLTIISQKHYIRIGNVELHPDKDTGIFADQVEFFDDETGPVASGNVLLTQGSTRIAADRAEFDTKPSLGTFYNATGIATIQQRQQPLRSAGVAPPPLVGQDNVVYFFGEAVEKIG